MASLLDHLEKILIEVKRFGKDSDAPEQDPFEYIASTQATRISASMHSAIGSFANQMFGNERSVSTNFTRKEWQSLVRQVFTDSLSQDLSSWKESTGEIILKRIKTRIRDKVQDIKPREYALGCTLFGNDLTSAVIVGPVRIEGRSHWLLRNVEAQFIDSISARRIEKVWRFGKKPRRRTKPIKKLREDDVLEAIGKCPFVCSVSTPAMGADTGRRRSVVAAKLALTATSLLWQKPSSALEGFKLQVDGPVRIQKVLSYTKGKITIAGAKISHLPMGYTFEAGEWEKIYLAKTSHFAVAGQIVQYYLNPHGCDNPILLHSLLQGLMWFGEACDEVSDPMAIVKFAASMDGLAGGTGVNGILNLLHHRCELDEKTMLTFKDGMTVKKAVESVYNDGRSRTAHGTNARLISDWTEDRDIAEFLARTCLLGAFKWFADNPLESDNSKLIAH